MRTTRMPWRTCAPSGSLLARRLMTLTRRRHEAYTIPHLLAAPARQFEPQLPPDLQREYDAHEVRRPAYADGADDAAAYYDDGAYVAQPESESEDGAYDGDAYGGDQDELGHANGQGDDRTELHEAYYASILARYRRLRALLHSPTPPDATRRLSPAQPTHAAPLSHASSTTRTWSRALRAADPHPLQLALMSKDSVLRVLRVLLGGSFLRRGYSLSERTSHWLWGLLARLPDPWELDNADVAWVRDLGRRAVLLGRSLADMAALRHELEHDALGVHEHVDAASSDADSDAGGDKPPPPPEAEAPDSTPAAEARDKRQEHPDKALEEGEVSEPGEADGGSVAMDLSSDSDRAADDAAALDAAKRALLARVQGTAMPTDDDAEAARLRLRINMRATLDMVFTVAGDFYGQRDLLEFREPFVGL